MSFFPPQETKLINNDDYFSSLPRDCFSGKHILPASSSMGSLMSASMQSRALTPSEMPTDPSQIVPVNFGIKFKPPKLGLQYHLQGRPDQQLVYEIPLLPFVTPEGLEKMPSVDAIVDHLFETHSAVITPRVIARRQIFRLVERVIAKAKE